MKKPLLIPMLLALAVFTGCPHTTSTTQESKLTDKTYSIDGSSFVMKAIHSVRDGMLGDDNQSNNKKHTVSLSAYRIGETEVTQELWKKVMNSNPSYFSDKPFEGETQGKRPVEKVTWYECIAFCNELTKKTDGLEEANCVYYRDSAFKKIYTKTDAKSNTRVFQNIDKKGFRLPTEAEWEWAAKGGAKTKWAGTDKPSDLKNYAWYTKNSKSITHEVRKKEPNGYGLYDMSGNVEEWVWDGYNEKLPESGEQDPIGDLYSQTRTVRGGHIMKASEECECAHRHDSAPGTKGYLRGFRLARRP